MLIDIPFLHKLSESWSDRPSTILDVSTTSSNKISHIDAAISVLRNYKSLTTTEVLLGLNFIILLCEQDVRNISKLCNAGICIALIEFLRENISRADAVNLVLDVIKSLTSSNHGDFSRDHLLEQDKSFCDIILQVIRKYKDDINISAKTCRVVEHLASAAKCQKDFGSKCGCKVVISIMSLFVYNSNILLMESCFRALIELSETNQENANYFIDTGACELILLWIKNMDLILDANKSDSICNGWQAISSLAQGSLNPTKLREKGVCDELILAMGNRDKTIKVFEYYCKTTAILTSDEPTADYLEHKGVCACLIDVLKGVMGDSSVVVQFATLSIAHLARVDSRRMKLGMMGACSLIIRRCTQHLSSNEVIIENCMYAISLLAMDCLENSIRLQENSFFPLLMKVMISHLSNSISNICCQTIIHIVISKNNDITKELVNVNVYETIVKVLEYHYVVTETCELCLKAISVLIIDNPSIVCRLSNKSRCKVIVKAFRRHRKNHSITKLACHILNVQSSIDSCRVVFQDWEVIELVVSTLSASSEDRELLVADCCGVIRNVSERNEDVRLKFAKFGAIKHLVDVAARHGHNSSTLLAIISSLAELAESVTNARYMCQASEGDVCELVNSILWAHGRDSNMELSYQCYRVLCSLAMEDSMSLELLEKHRTYDAVVSALHISFAESPKIARIGCRAIHILASTCNGRLRLGDVGACEAIFGVIEIYRNSNVLICEQALYAISGLAKNCSVNAKKLASLGATTELIGILQQTHCSDRMSEAIYKVIVEMPCITTQLIDAGVCESIVPLLREHHTIESVSKWGCRALITLASDSNGRSKLAFLGACEVVVLVLSHHSTQAAAPASGLSVSLCGMKGLDKCVTCLPLLLITAEDAGPAHISPTTSTHNHSNSKLMLVSQAAASLGQLLEWGLDAFVELVRDMPLIADRSNYIQIITKILDRYVGIETVIISACAALFRLFDCTEECVSPQKPIDGVKEARLVTCLIQALQQHYESSVLASAVFGVLLNVTGGREHILTQVAKDRLNFEVITVTFYRHMGNNSIIAAGCELISELLSVSHVIPADCIRVCCEVLLEALQSLSSTDSKIARIALKAIDALTSVNTTTMSMTAACDVIVLPLVHMEDVTIVKTCLSVMAKLAYSSVDIATRLGRLDVAQKVTVTMLYHSLHPEVVRNGIRTLDGLATSLENWPRLKAAQACRAMSLGIMPHMDTSLVEFSLGRVTALAKRDIGSNMKTNLIVGVLYICLRLKFGSVGAAGEGCYWLRALNEALMTCDVEEFPDTDSLTKVTVLALLSFTQEGTAEYASELTALVCALSPACLKTLGPSGVCELLVRNLEGFGGNIQVTRHVCSALSALAAESEANCVMLFNAGAPKAISQSLAIDDDGYAFVLEDMLSVLASMAVNEEAKDKLGDICLCEGIVSVMFRYVSNETLIRSACRAIVALSSDHADNINRFITAEACKCILDAVRCSGQKKKKRQQLQGFLSDIREALEALGVVMKL